MLGVAVDVGGHTVRLDLVFQDISERLSAMDGVDDGIEVIGDVVTAFLKLSHDVPHGTVGVLTAVFADTDRIVHDVAWRGFGVLESWCEQLDNLVLAVHQSVVGLAHDGDFLLLGSHIGEDGPGL